MYSLKAISYSIAYFCQHEEYSVREYATHFVEYVLQLCRARMDKDQEEIRSLVNLMEQQFVQDYLRMVKDEMVLKSVLICLRSLVLFCHDTQIRDNVGIAQFHCLTSADTDLDFFHTLFSIKIKQRQRCLTNLAQKIEADSFGSSMKSFEKMILPFLDYITLAGAHQLQNRRNTITYDQQHKRELLETALQVYKAFASKLKYADYFRCIKKYLFKLKRAEKGVRNAKMNAAEPEMQVEKIVTKIICHFLNGFSFGSFPDAIEEIVEKDAASQKLQ